MVCGERRRGGAPPGEHRAPADAGQPGRQNAGLYERLQATTKELSSTNERLESEVAIRTAELRRETQQLRETQARLVKLEKEATEVRMAGGFAHEMRNALASAKLFLTKVYSDRGDEVSCVCYDTIENLKQLLLLSREHMPPDAIHRVVRLMEGAYENEKQIVTVLGGVSTNIERSLRVTKLILDYSRKGFELPGRDPISLRELLKGIVREFDMDFSQNNISVVLEAPQEFVLLGDERHFYSIINNLITNARDALVETEGRARVLRIKLVEQADGIIVLDVMDGGNGIAPEHRAKIFEPFFSTKPNSGTGLGLGIVEKLVSLYGGTIGIDSEVNRGTTVSVRLPQSAS
jgi:histidine kinase